MPTSLPEALRMTVLQRLSQLTRAQRSVLMRAAVIGRHFDVSIVVEIAGCPEAVVLAVLERAQGLQIVVPAGPKRYSFRHGLTREIIYTEFFSSRARALHLRIVRALEKAGSCSETSLADLAYHAWAAANARRTLRYNELAGDRAAAVHATQDARTYYSRARSFLGVGSTAHSRLTEKLGALGGER